MQYERSFGPAETPFHKPTHLPVCLFLSRFPNPRPRNQSIHSLVHPPSRPNPCAPKSRFKYTCGTRVLRKAFAYLSVCSLGGEDVSTVEATRKVGGAAKP